MNQALRQGREAYRQRAWETAFTALMRADRAVALKVEDLERLAGAAYLTGRDTDFHRILERAYHAHCGSDDAGHAARCAFWLGLTSIFRGEPGQGSGWLARARRLVEGRDCVEQGYLLLPVAEQQIAAEDPGAAQATAAQAAGIGERFTDRDLIACARHLQGRAVILGGEVAAGLALLDEAMLAVVGGELSPIVTGLVYCSVIEACQQVFAVQRAGEWTSALARWCGQQPEMVAFTATCLVHRAEILQIHGAWPAALAEARRACARPPPGGETGPAAPAALYRQGEIHRLSGAYAEAEAAYREAARLGCEPQPGLALLRLAQGHADAACAALRRLLGATADPLRRAALLPAQIEVLLAMGALEPAEEAGSELERIAGRFATEALLARAAQARGSIDLARGDAQAALAGLRRAFETWNAIEAPYEAATARALMAQACLALGDRESAERELQAARAVFERLGAGPDLARLDRPDTRDAPGPHHGLTARECQVLRLIAAGRTNKGVAAELDLSERTIDRHVSNILRKLDVPTRAAAIALAYRLGLLTR